MTIKVVHYINQFYAGIGGEKQADLRPEVRKGMVGVRDGFSEGFW